MSGRYGRPVVAFVVLLAVVLSSCGQRQPSVVAVVDGEEITQQDLDVFINLNFRLRDPSLTFTVEERRELLNEMITNKLLYAEALEQGFEPDSEAVAEEYQNYTKFIADTFFEGSESRYQARLQELDLTADLILGWFTIYHAVSDLLADVRERAVKPTAEEVEVFYETNKAQFAQGERRRLRHILLNEDSFADEEAGDPEDFAWEIYQQLMAGGDFAQLAALYSADAYSKDNGGNIGTFEKKDLLPEVADHVFELELGVVGEPQQSIHGWHIFEVLEIIEPGFVPIEDVFDQIYDYLLGVEQDRKVNTLIDRLERQAKIDIKL